MLLFKALRNRSVSLLWQGQMISCIGDELYRMAFIWILVGLVGSNTGPLTALLSLSVLLVTLFAGKWTDHWNPFRILLYSDLFRMVLVLLIVIAYFFFSTPLWFLTLISILIVGAGGLYDPALHSILPRYCEDSITLQAANGLMSTTLRMARVVAPLLIGLMTTRLPTIHFFTIDAFTYLAAVIAVLILRKHPPRRKVESFTLVRQGVFESLASAYQILRNKHSVWRALLFKTFTGGIWQMCYGVGFAILVKKNFSNDLGAYGVVMGAYGVGNLLSALIVGNWQRKHPEKLVYFGLAVLGVGFTAASVSPSLLTLALSAAFIAIGGPLNDTPFTDLVMQEYSGHEIQRIIRLRSAGDNGFSLFFYLMMPVFLRFLSIEHLILISGITIFLIALFGILNLRKNPA